MKQNLKKNLLSTALIIVLTGCVDTNRVNPKQAVQILGMINLEQNKDTFERNEDIHYQSTIIDGNKQELYDLCVNPKKKIVSLTSDDGDAYLDQYYLVENDVFVRYYKENREATKWNKEIIANSEDATQQFAYYLDGLNKEIKAKIAEIDKPLEYSEIFKTLEKNYEKKYKMSFKTPKDSILYGDLYIYADEKKKDLESHLYLNYHDNVLVNYRLYEGSNSKVYVVEYNYNLEAPNFN